MPFNAFTAVVLLSILGPWQLALSEPPKELEKLQGRWKVHEAKPGFEPNSLVFEGDKVRFERAGEVVKTATVKIDSTVKPANLDLAFEDGKTMLGIFSMGRATARICFSTNDQRPKVLQPANDVIYLIIHKDRK
jgi:uncharacterized protein (TIGR03067 family)